MPVKKSDLFDAEHEVRCIYTAPGAIQEDGDDSCSTDMVMEVWPLLLAVLHFDQKNRETRCGTENLEIIEIYRNVWNNLNLKLDSPNTPVAQTLSHSILQDPLHNSMPYKFYQQMTVDE